MPQFAAYDDGAETVLARNRAPGLVVPRAEVVRSRYARVAAQIFPGRLVGREEERAELAAFCTGRSDSPHGYVWWRAPAWAGKSALMASLVLDPPERVRVVSFFVTARLAGQSDRAAFLEAVPAQLSELVGQQPPGGLTEHSRLTWFWDLLEQAAQTCAERGERLVLLVDGLDEDRGIGVGDDAHSIAGALPARLPDGVRVVVAGRPDPPVPPDVPDGHPLRDGGIVRQLAPSPYAKVAREAARRELNCLLKDTGLGGQVLGLVAAAGGGLAAEDLAELTGEAVGTVEEVLTSTAGRTFTARPRQWSTRNLCDKAVYTLSHEELQVEALRNLPRSELSRLHAMLHGWADGYRERRWPAETPEYLLRGYMKLLRDTGDLPRMRALATDSDRLDRMLDLSGGDAAALADIATVHEHLLDQPDPDLSACLHLALTRDRFKERNSHIPADLPAIWVLLGNPNRAEALARSITDPYEQVQALSALVSALVEAGEPDRAREVATTAETTARSITDPYAKDQALRGLVSALAAAGESDRAKEIATTAETTIRPNANPSTQAEASSDPVSALVAAGELDRAEVLVRSITDPYEQVQALSELVPALVEAGEPDRAREVATTAETTARSIAHPHTQAQALSELVSALAVAGELGLAETAARSITDPRAQAQALNKLVSAWASAGEPDRVREIATDVGSIACSITDPHDQARPLHELVSALTAVGELGLAEAAARSITHPSARAQALNELVSALVAAGEPDRAEVLVRSRRSSYARAEALRVLVSALAAAGESDRAREIATTAETTARSITNPRAQAQALCELVSTLAAAGEPDRAEAAARSITDPHAQAQALNKLVSAWASAGEPDRAREIATTAETTARSITNPRAQAQALCELVSTLAAAGEPDRAREIATTAETIARSITNPYAQDRPLRELVSAWAAAGEPHRAETAAHSIINPYARAQTLSELFRGNKLIAPRRTAAQALTQASIPLLSLLALVDPQAVVENAIHIAPAPPR